LAEASFGFGPDVIGLGRVTVIPACSQARICTAGIAPGWARENVMTPLPIISN
jgi:hypothetical protein